MTTVMHIHTLGHGSAMRVTSLGLWISDNQAIIQCLLSVIILWTTYAIQIWDSKYKEQLPLSSGKARLYNGACEVLVRTFSEVRPFLRWIHHVRFSKFNRNSEDTIWQSGNQGGTNIFTLRWPTLCLTLKHRMRRNAACVVTEQNSKIFKTVRTVQRKILFWIKKTV